MKTSSFFVQNLFLALLTFLALLVPAFVSAGTEHNLDGYAWSSTIGWVSFNCTNTDTCASSDYGVNKNADGTLVGYAWSSNIGWIKFGGLSGFPSGGGTQSQNANVNGNNVKGWARALSYGGGWDGWISLSGAGYGVSLSGDTYQGYAWGGDVVGWLSFNVHSSAAALDIKSSGVSIVGNTGVEYGTVPTFVWTLYSASMCDVAKASSGGTAFATTTVRTSGQALGSALTNATYLYRLSCLIGGATTTVQDVGFTVLPQAPGFTLGAADTVKIQFITPAVGESEAKSVFVNANQAFKDLAGHPSVTVTITGTPSLPASTTMQYSFDGGTTYGTAGSRSKVVASDYSTGLSFRVKVTRLEGAPAFVGPYTVTLSGSAPGYTTATKDIIISPTSVVPRYEEF
jgi:hypothetical protein